MLLKKSLLIISKILKRKHSLNPTIKLKDMNDDNNNLKTNKIYNKKYNKYSINNNLCNNLNPFFN